MDDSTTRRIPLTQGRFALVDAEDFEMLSHWKWHVSGPGYVASCNKGHSIYLHRLLLLPDSMTEIDHINGDPLDNRRCNLRVCTSGQNKQNARLRRDSTSGFKGVTWDSSRQIWRAQMRLNGAHLALGSHKTAEEAARAYDAAVRKLFGEFARPNHPD